MRLDPGAQTALGEVLEKEGSSQCPHGAATASSPAWLASPHEPPCKGLEWRSRSVLRGTLPQGSGAQSGTQGPTLQPRDTEAHPQGPSLPGRSALTGGNWTNGKNTSNSLQKHCKTPPACRMLASLLGSTPSGHTAHTRHTLSRLLCGWPSRQSLIFKKRLTMYYS